MIKFHFRLTNKRRENFIFILISMRYQKKSYIILVEKAFKILHAIEIINRNKYSISI